MAATKKLRLPPRALSRLRRSDPRLAEVFSVVGPCKLSRSDAASDLESLVRAIVFQQLSGKAAATIYRRFVALFETDTFPAAATIAKMHHAKLRKAGVSRQKQAAIKDLCRHVNSGRLPLEALGGLEDEALIERLTAVRGIGRWSAHMFMMFHLGRLDVWPVDDLGVRKGMQRLGGLRELPKPREMVGLGEPYAPLRSVVAWYMWRWIDGVELAT